MKNEINKIEHDMMIPQPGIYLIDDTCIYNLRRLMSGIACAPNIEYTKVEINDAIPYFEAAIRDRNTLSPDMFTNMAFPGMMCIFEYSNVTVQMTPHLMDENEIIFRSSSESNSMAQFIGYFDVNVFSAKGLITKTMVIGLELINPLAAGINEDPYITMRMGFPDDPVIISEFDEFKHQTELGLNPDDRVMKQVLRWARFSEKAIAVWIGAQLSMRNPIVRESISVSETKPNSIVNNEPLPDKKIVGAKYVHLSDGMKHYNSIVKDVHRTVRPHIRHGFFRHYKDGKVIWIHWTWVNAKNGDFIINEDEPREVEIVPLFKRV